MGTEKSQNNLRERLVSDSYLFLAAIIWGGGFVAQRMASFHLGFNAFNGIRFLLGGLVLLFFVFRRFRKSRGGMGWVLLAGGVLFAASSLQQIGIGTTSASTAGFITGTYVVLVPILLAVFWRQRTPLATWIAALVALAGTYLLSTGGLVLIPSSGSLILLAGSAVWALHVIVVGLAVNKMDVFVFSVGQFLVCGAIHLVMSMFIEPVSIPALRASWLPLLYAALLSVALGFTFQAIGQKKAPSADAALILSLEAVFAAITGALFLNESLNLVQVIGCVIILAAILFAQLIVLKKNRGSA
ncbi:MAG TPA: DMT family transporter [Anaerolineaceae bacterium]|nr:DMT family transporter [Anaerolineaceae bacterium]